MSTTKIAWALLRKWAAHYGVPVKAIKSKHFGWAMTLANTYRKASGSAVLGRLERWM